MSRIWDALQRIPEWDGDNTRSQRFVQAARSRAASDIVGDPVIKIESVEVGPNAEIIVYNDPLGVLADRCRFLRANLRPLWSADKLKSLLITSTFPHEGKSTVALNLAITLAERGNRKVLLIEGDLHYPAVTRRLGLGDSDMAGLTDCLEGAVKDPFSTIRWVEPIGIYLLPAGKPSAHPTELLQSDVLSNVMQSLCKEFDCVLVDSPPVQPRSDTLLLRQRTDATLLVLRAGRTLRPAVDEAVALLGKKNIVAMVLNGVDGLERVYSRYYGSYGGKVK